MSIAVAERTPTLFDAVVDRAAPPFDPTREHAAGPGDATREHAARPGDATVERSPSSFDAVGDEPTLDEVLSGVWEGLIAHRVEECPVCGGHLVPDYVPDYAQHVPIGGHCVDCGSALS